jgi:hypothetical protein
MEVPYKTSLKKLVKYFETSRDKWKQRAQEACYENKLKRNRITFLEESKEKLKLENSALKKRLSELELQEALNKDVGVLKKN